MKLIRALRDYLRLQIDHMSMLDFESQSRTNGIPLWPGGDLTLVDYSRVQCLSWESTIDVDRDGAADADSRPASGRTRSGRDESCDHAGRGFSSRARGQIAGTEKDTGDFAVGRVIKTCVKRTQGEDEAVAAGLREVGGIGTRAAASQPAPEPDCGHHADFEELVERQ